MRGIQVARGLVIPAAEVEVNFTTHGGPGGQHANRSSTKVELAWNVEDSSVLTANQRRLIRSRLGSRIDRSGTLRVAAASTRSQHRNRAEAEVRLGKLVAGALRRRRSRIATKPSQAARERRLEAKRRRSQVKRARGRPVDD